MRINGFKQINAFYSWVFEHSGEVRQSHISLYVFLWNQNNRSNWIEWFKCPYDLAMQGACIGSKSTYYKCLDDLQSWGLIKYTKGLNNYKSPQISLPRLYKSEQASEPLTVPLSEQVIAPVSEPLSGLLTGKIYKLVTTNYKLVNSNLEKWIDSEAEENINLFESEEITFEVFWDLYDKKTGKPKCQEKWKEVSPAKRKLLMDHIPKYKISQPEKRYRKNPLTYLNGESWNDEIIESNGTKVNNGNPQGGGTAITSHRSDQTEYTGTLN